MTPEEIFYLLMGSAVMIFTLLIWKLQHEYYNTNSWSSEIANELKLLRKVIACNIEKPYSIPDTFKQMIDMMDENNNKLIEKIENMSEVNSDILDGVADLQSLAIPHPQIRNETYYMVGVKGKFHTIKQCNCISRLKESSISYNKLKEITLEEKSAQNLRSLGFMCSVCASST